MGVITRRRVVRVGLGVLGVLAVVVGASVTWTYVASAGHRYTADEAPAAPVVIVFGAKVANEWPMPFLAGRLDVTARLVHEGKAGTVLVSGDAAGTSGNETRAMIEYLVAKGVDPALITEDRFGLDTYDTCARAVRVYGVTRALLVTQSYHLPRTVSVCRDLGMDAEGVDADCPACTTFSLVRNRAREWLATVGAVGEAIWNRDPAVLTRS